MSSITTKAALFLLRENNISFLIGDQMLAWSGHVGQDTGASVVVTTVDLVRTHAVVCLVVVELAVEGVGFSAVYEGLVVRHVEGWAPDGAFWIVERAYAGKCNKY